jgi:hypothetical protein
MGPEKPRRILEDEKRRLESEAAEIRTELQRVSKLRARGSKTRPAFDGEAAAGLRSPTAELAVTRQVLCYGCSERIFTDDEPPGFPPPYCCLACRGTWMGRTWLATPGEEEARRKKEEEWSKRQLVRTERALRIETTGEPTIQAPAVRLSKAELRRLRIREREEEIFSKPLNQLTQQEKEWLLKVDRLLHHKTRAGRPRKDRNEDWLAKIARAKVLGIKKPTLQELAAIQRPSKDAPPGTRDAYMLELEKLRDALKKAMKRRELPLPPMS